MRARHMTSHPDTAVIVIDMQNDFCAEGGYIETAIGRDAAPCRAIVPAVKALVTTARAADIPVIWIGARYGAELIHPVFRRKQLQNSEAVCCADGSWGIEFFGVEPEGDEQVLYKTTFSAFIETGLAEDLRSRGITRLIFAGVQTNVCVDHSVRDAFAYGFECLIPADCVASHAPQLHDASLTTLGLLYAEVTDLATVTASLTSVEA